MIIKKYPGPYHSLHGPAFWPLHVVLLGRIATAVICIPKVSLQKKMEFVFILNRKYPGSIKTYEKTVLLLAIFIALLMALYATA